MKTLARNTFAAFALGTLLGAPLGALAVENSVHRTFTGTVTHVSTLNVKVQGVEGGKQQTLSFVYLPRFGKASPIYKVHAGEYVRVTYDQKGAGARHVTKIEERNKAMKM